MKKRLLSTLLALCMALALLPGAALAARSSGPDVILNSATLTPLKTGTPELDNMVDDIFSQIFTEGMSTYQKVKACYDYLISHTEYELTSLTVDSSYIPYTNWNDYVITLEALELLTSGKGVCDDYAAAFLVMTRRIGLESYVFGGQTSKVGGGYTPHAWNVITIDGTDYVFDVQVEDNIAKGGPIQYYRFCKTFDEVSQNYIDYDAAACKANFGGFVYDGMIEPITDIQLDKGRPDSVTDPATAPSTPTPTTPSQSAEASGSCGDGVTWSYSDGTLTIQGTGSMDDFDNPYLSYEDEEKEGGTKDDNSAPWTPYAEQIYTVNIGHGVKNISVGSTAVCKNLTNVSIPDSVTTIDEYAFRSCGNLSSVTIPDSVTTIGECAFAYCSSLTSVTIPSGVTTIEANTFRECSSLSSVIILDNVTTIETLAFLKCSSLTALTIPDSITSIGRSAFDVCDSLTDVYYGGSESQWKQIAIEYGNDPLTTATIHYNSTMPSAPTTPSTPTPTAPAQTTNAVLSPQKLTVNGADVECEKYNIGGSNYFKLRDLAYLLNGTASQFEVGFDAAASAVSITTGAAYTPVGTELAAGVDNAGTAQPSRQTILINGTERSDLTVYNIGGSNFFQLRELGTALGFAVDFDAASNTAIVSSASSDAQ